MAQNILGNWLRFAASGPEKRVAPIRCANDGTAQCAIPLPGPAAHDQAIFVENTVEQFIKRVG